MATYVPILDTQLDPDAPLTSSLMYQMRDNTLAMAEGDTSVPLAAQLGHRVLGTLVTTSGTTVTLSSLDLTKFRFIKFVFNGVSYSGAGNPNVTIGGAAVYSSVGSGDTAYGNVEIDLVNGIGFSVISSVTVNPGNADATSKAVRTSIVNASTSVSVACANAFDAGSIRVYGVQ
jgi:hypothetical protein